jgi:hypothetical protein
MSVSPLLHLPRNWDLIIAIFQSDNNDDDDYDDDNDTQNFQSNHTQLITARGKSNQKFLPDIFW